MTAITQKQSSLGLQNAGMHMPSHEYMLSSDDPLSSIDMTDGSRMWVLTACSQQGNNIYHFVKVLKSGESESLIVNPMQLNPSDQMKFLPLQLCLWERSNALMAKKMETAQGDEKRFLSHAQAMLASINQDIMASREINRNLLDTVGCLEEQSRTFGQSVIRFQSNVHALGQEVSKLKAQVNETARELKQFRAETWTSGVKYSTTVPDQTTDLDLHSIFNRFVPPDLEQISDHSGGVPKQLVMRSSMDDGVLPTASLPTGSFATSSGVANIAGEPPATQRGVLEQATGSLLAPKNSVGAENRGGSHTPAYSLQSTQSVADLSLPNDLPKPQLSIEKQEAIIEKDDDSLFKGLWSKWSAFLESILGYFSSIFKPFSS